MMVLFRPLKILVKEIFYHRIRALYPHTRFLFIISMMRSGSTLLAHLLASSPEIVGFGESWIEYHSYEQLESLIARVYRERRLIPSKKFIVMDKINHRAMLKFIDILNHHRLKTIILIRKPDSTISSMLQSGFPNTDSEDYCARYYMSRLDDFVQYASTIRNPQNLSILTYEHLIGDSSEVLSKLRQFLFLRKEINKTYKTFWFTGKPLIGDHSENIRSGKIIENYKPELVPISQSVLDRCNEAYTVAMKRLNEISTFF